MFPFALLQAPYILLSPFADGRTEVHAVFGMQMHRRVILIFSILFSTPSQSIPNTSFSNCY